MIKTIKYYKTGEVDVDKKQRKITSAQSPRG